MALHHDLRDAVRSVRHRPGFAAVVVLTLALAFGSTSAIFSVVDAFLFRPLPYGDPESVALVLGFDAREGEILFNTHERDLVDWRAERIFSVEQIGAYRYVRANLTGAGDPVMLRGYAMTSNVFDILRVRAAEGRALVASDADPGATPVAVLSEGARRRLFGDRPPVGATVSINDVAHVIVGVMPEGFEFPQMNWSGEVWIPMRIDAAARAVEGEGASIVTIARLRGTPEEAKAELDVVSRRAAAARGDELSTTVVVNPMQAMMREQAGPGAMILAFAAAIVLFIACANVAALLFAHHLGRLREIAIRVALGAQKRRIIRLLVVETLVLFGLGTVASLPLSAVILSGLQALVPESLRLVIPTALSFGVDLKTFAFAAVLAVATALLLGALAAVRTSRADLETLLRRTTGTGPAGQRLRAAIVVGEVALALVLLVATTLTVATVRHLARTDLGFNPGNLLTFEIALPEERYAEAAQRAAFFEDAQTGFMSIPGVSAAGAVSRMPFSTTNTTISFGIVGEEEPARPRRADFRIADPSYFGTMGIHLARGRLLTSQDTGESMPVALVNERLVDRYLSGAEPLGRRISIGEDIVTIVGVIGNVRHAEISAQPAPELYVPLAQAPPFTMSFAVRTLGDSGSIGPAVRRAVASIDPGQPVAMMATMESMVDFAMPQRMLMKLLVAFAGVALALAAIGLYGVLAHAVASRTREIGLRMALGAEGRTVRREVIGRGLRLTAIGAVIGGAGGLAVARVMRGLFAGVSPFDPLAFSAALFVLFAIALLACWVPGSRASGVDPIVALREE